MDFKLFWTDEAIKNLEEILDYLAERWTEREVEVFKNKLSKQLDLILINPRMFPVSLHNPKLRKAVLSKQTSIFYEIRGNIVYLVYLFINHRNIDNIIE